MRRRKNGGVVVKSRCLTIKHEGDLLARITGVRAATNCFVIGYFLDFISAIVEHE
jgi:hypothetical protein